MNLASGAAASSENKGPEGLFFDRRTMRFRFAWKANALIYRRRKSYDNIRDALTRGMKLRPPQESFHLRRTEEKSSYRVSYMAPWNVREAFAYNVPHILSSYV
jgi:hypothetical protein